MLQEESKIMAEVWRKENGIAKQYVIYTKVFKIRHLGGNLWWYKNLFLDGWFIQVIKEFNMETNILLQLCNINIYFYLFQVSSKYKVV